MNVLGDRARANSPAEAATLSIENLKKTKCRWCDALAQGIYNVLGTEEVSFYPIFLYFGYTCKCGEKVKVLETEEGYSFDIPETITASCSKGHSRTILNREFLSLEHWKEQTQ